MCGREHHPHGCPALLKARRGTTPISLTFSVTTDGIRPYQNLQADWSLVVLSLVLKLSCIWLVMTAGLGYEAAMPPLPLND
jgi:hypothetical protein